MKKEKKEKKKRKNERKKEKINDSRAHLSIQQQRNNKDALLINCKTSTTLQSLIQTARVWVCAS